MTGGHGYLASLLANLVVVRERAGLSETELEERLILGPGWIHRFESAQSVPSIDMLLAILHETGATLPDLLQGLPQPEASEVERVIFAEQTGKDLSIRFNYADHNAMYRLKRATLDQFEVVIKTLRDGLARLATAENQQAKTEAVAGAFLKAAQLWPHANPSDLWWFVIYRAFCDPYNHPARFARLAFEQSWKRTGGWALEVILVRHYGQFLKKHGINLFIADARSKQNLIDGLEIATRIEADKIDVVLTGDVKGRPKFFGVVHVKASFAERRTDDVPMSEALTKAGYVSPLWTMDCKSMPGPFPINRGELGDATGERSAKRKDIEDEGYFTGCFSYNKRTQPSSSKLPEKRRVHVCDFSNADDAFSQFIIKRWREFRSS
jgi:transcriptional regulator with XRE-family HTH domain